MSRVATLAAVAAVLLGSFVAPPATARAVDRAAGVSAPHATASLVALVERAPCAAVRDPRDPPAAPHFSVAGVRGPDVAWRARPGRRPDGPDRPGHRKRPLPRGATADPTLAD
jgi:hypothetical protein